MRRTRKRREPDGSGVQELNGETTKMEELLTEEVSPVADVKIPDEVDAKVAYEGRRQRKKGIVGRINELNAKDKDWHYVLGEEFKSDGLPQDGLDMLLEDEFVIIDKAEAERILGYALRGRQKLLKIEKWKSEINRAESIREATQAFAKPNSDDKYVDFGEFKQESKIIKISR